MSVHKISLRQIPPQPVSGRLRMGGLNPDGVEINANSQYLTFAGQPWYPVMGEYHFSRAPRADWRTELLKMKAGGINVVATYVFWNYHEEKQGTYTWRGNRSLRDFIALCAETGLYAYPRIGPWAHGEARNGGFPDWLLRECGDLVRCDDPRYLAFVRPLYAQIAAQLQGLLWKDGGPVIGIQVENELYNNAAHIVTLKAMAIEAGLDVPIYTMTGWGPAQVPDHEVIPVFGGYPDAFWERQTETWARASRKHYFFSAIRDDNTIGADLRRSASAPDLSFLDDYPYGTCELGGGMPPAYHRRPLIDPRDIDALAFCKVGSGANLLGYYMYHGGSHAKTGRGFLNESQATGYPNDLPAVSYDFQAPLGEYGQVRPHYHRLRRLHTFLHDFGARLAQLPPAFPALLPASVEDRDAPRWAVRSAGSSGFLFANTYQRIEALPAQSAIQFELDLPGGSLLLPPRPVDLPAGVQCLWPFGLDLSGVRLHSATANLLCRLPTPLDECTVFYAADGLAPEFAFRSEDISAVTGSAHQIENIDGLTLLNGLIPGPDCLLEVNGVDGASARLLVLSAADSLRLWKLDLWGEQRLILCPAGLWQDGERLHLTARETQDLWFAVFPAPALSPAGWQAEPKGIFTCFSAHPTPLEIPCELRKIQPAGKAKAVALGPGGVAQAPGDSAYESAEIWAVRVPPGALQELREVYLQIRYTGDAARAYLPGEMIAGMEMDLISDDFYSGRPWEIGLSRHASRLLNEGLELRILPLRADAPVYITPECKPRDNPDQFVALHEVRLIPEYEMVFP